MSGAESSLAAVRSLMDVQSFGDFTSAARCAGFHRVRRSSATDIAMVNARGGDQHDAAVFGQNGPPAAAPARAEDAAEPATAHGPPSVGGGDWIKRFARDGPGTLRPPVRRLPSPNRCQEVTRCPARTPSSAATPLSRPTLDGPQCADLALPVLAGRVAREVPAQPDGERLGGPCSRARRTGGRSRRPWRGSRAHTASRGR